MAKGKGSVTSSVAKRKANEFTSSDESDDDEEEGNHSGTEMSKEELEEWRESYVSVSAMLKFMKALYTTEAKKNEWFLKSQLNFMRSLATIACAKDDVEKMAGLYNKTYRWIRTYAQA